MSQQSTLNPEYPPAQWIKYWILRITDIKIPPVLPLIIVVPLNRYQVIFEVNCPQAHIPDPEPVPLETFSSTLPGTGSTARMHRHMTPGGGDYIGWPMPRDHPQAAGWWLDGNQGYMFHIFHAAGFGTCSQSWSPDIYADNLVDRCVSDLDRASFHKGIQ